tara:strand:- start:1165 stop:5547 length:4383 start_codon:yes stop_codon:yes gene_type:complete
MPLVPLKLPAGFYRNGTEYEGSYRWRDGNLVRWVDGSLRPVGGWQLRKSTFLNNVCRGLHTWQSNDGTAWIAGGSHDQLCGMTGGGFKYNLTPDDLAEGREDAAVGTGFGNSFYGTGYYGQPRPSSSASIPQEATTWQLDNFGQNLIGFHYDDGRLWEWDLSTFIGPELITNGDFATDSDWTKGTNWSISGGVAEYQLYKPTINANDATIVDAVNDTITINAHKFVDGDEITYAVPTGQVAIGGLTTATNYFIVSATTNNFKLAATSGGAPIDLTPNYEVIFDADDGAIKDIVNNKIIISNTFTNGDAVTYNNGGGTDISGLTNDASYFIVGASSSEFQLSATLGGAAIDLTADPTTTIDPNGIATSATSVAVTVASGTLYGGGTGNIFYLDGVANPSLTLIQGTTYTFDVSDGTNGGHPFRFKDALGNTFAVTASGTEGTAGATVTLTVPTSGTMPASYYCTVHGAGMGNLVTTVTAAAANGPIDYATETITIASHGLSDGNEVTYSNGGGTDIGGLTTGTNYFVVSASTDTFKLSATSGGSAINLTAPSGSLGTNHSFELDIGSTHVVRLDIGSSHELKRINFGNLDQTVTGLLPQTNPVTVNADDTSVVDVANDNIVIANTFAANTKVRYSNGGGSDIGGLVNDTDYFVLGSSASQFQLASISGGTAIDLTAPRNLTFDADNASIIDVTNDKIVSTNNFVTGDNVIYNNGGGVNIGGLTSGTSYFVVSASSAEFQLATTSGGTPITLTANNEVTFDADNASVNKSVTITDSTDTAVVDATNDKIIISNTFTNGEQVTYSNGGGTDIAGLTNGTTYFIISASGTEFQLASTSGGSAIDITGVGVGNNHVFQHVGFAVDLTNNKIISANTFTNGIEVVYNVGGGAAINGLTDGTNYFIVNASASDFQLSSTSGGSAISLSDNVTVTIDSTDTAIVDATNDKIIVSNTFSDGQEVVYSNGGGTDIAGLVDGTNYFIISASGTEFQLSATSGGAAIDITGVGVGTAHTFRQDIGSAHIFRQDIGSAHTLIKNLGTAHTFTHNIGDDQDTFDLEVTLIDPNDDANVATVPDVKVKITGVNTTTVYVDKTLVVGPNIFRFGSDDTQAKIEIIPQAYDTPNFDIDNVSLKQKTVAEPIENAPINNKGVVVTEERFIFALGAGGNSRKVQWCDKENNTVWAAAATNEAGDIELATVGQIMQGIKTRGQVLIITDTDAHTAQYIGPPYVYGFQKIGQHCGAISRLSAVSTDYGVFWFGQESFHFFDGNSVQELPCEVKDYVFSDFNQDQQSKVWGMALGGENEIWWFYPSGGSLEIDRYVGYNYADKHWLLGNLSRTAGAARGVFANPLMADHTTVTNLQNHEQGFNYDSSPVFCETGPISIGNGDNIIKVTEVIPDEKTQGNVDLKFKSKFYPNDTERTYGPFNPSNPTSVRFSGRQIKMRVEGDSATNWNVGTMRLETKTGGRR